MHKTPCKRDYTLKILHHCISSTHSLLEKQCPLSRIEDRPKALLYLLTLTQILDYDLDFQYRASYVQAQEKIKVSGQEVQKLRVETTEQTDGQTRPIA